MTKNNENAPDVDWQTALKLWTVAGGRCSFLGCNKYLLRDNLTTKEIKNGHIAHIVARSKDGARGDNPLPMSQRSEIHNLMLVCLDHHLLIDNKKYEAEYPVELLQKYKQEHEARIEQLTAITPDRKTQVIRLQTRINSENVNITYPQVLLALADEQRYPNDSHGVNIDLTNLQPAERHEVVKVGVDKIQHDIGYLFEHGFGRDAVKHISVFALAPIPLLVYLGSRLSNKIPTDIYQRHRDTEDWIWKPEPGQLEFSGKLLRDGTDKTQVALLLSISGELHLDQLPPEIDTSFYVYEIKPQDRTPHTELLRTKSDLGRFRTIYQEFLAEVRKEHPAATTVHLFPAVPAPIAIVCGRELLHKIPPTLQVYDSRHGSGFSHTLEIT